LTHVKQQNFYGTTKVVDIIRTVYPRPLTCQKFICVNYGPYTLLSNDSVFTFIEYLHYSPEAKHRFG